MSGYKNSGSAVCQVGQDGSCQCGASRDNDAYFKSAAESNAVSLEAFWCRVSQLTTRIRNNEGEWVGSDEARQWNHRNKETCTRCQRQRGPTWKACLVEDDQLNCSPCRDSKMSCDRKTKFIFEYTKDQFFPTMEEFMRVYSKKDHADCKVYRKWASRKLRATLPYTDKPPRNQVQLGAASTILLNTRAEPSPHPQVQADNRIVRIPPAEREKLRAALLTQIQFLSQCYDEEERPMFLDSICAEIEALCRSQGIRLETGQNYVVTSFGQASALQASITPR
ncbi:hypothetical protein R3P38DRAFT_2701295 [Favolaschia claudopus]|uniref:Zn(2)-C6 fungal-type domain-containing protein n=1 Tax=Favolaschia claudopus TaxID=2862362 RepID=A0AAW0BX93_9AGAR